LPSLLVSNAGAQNLAAPYIPQEEVRTGQDVVPSYDGFLKNADGTFTMVSGYMNRNYEEELVIPDRSGQQAGTGNGGSGATYLLPSEKTRLGVSSQGAGGLG